MPNNYEFIKSLSVSELAGFLTDGLLVKYRNNNDLEPFYLSMRAITKSNLNNENGCVSWLKQECIFEVVR